MVYIMREIFIIIFFIGIGFVIGITRSEKCPSVWEQEYKLKKCNDALQMAEELLK